MILTGKCLEAFLDWRFKNVSMVFNGCPESVDHALIIEFFDSVGIYICPVKLWGRWSDFFDTELTQYKTRVEATTEAIKKANEIFNSKT